MTKQYDSCRDSLSKSKALAYAEDNGLTPVIREANQLQVDIDSPDGDINRRVLSVIEQRYKVLNEVRYKSKSGNTHIILTVDASISDHEALTYQAALGSDPVREVLSMFRYLDGEEYTSMLFRCA